MRMLAVLLLAGTATSAAQDPKKPPAPAEDRVILWTASWESALMEASARNIPLFYYLSSG